MHNIIVLFLIDSTFEFYTNIEKTLSKKGHVNDLEI